MTTSTRSARATEVAVFRGSTAQCAEFGLVLDAKGIAYERHTGGIEDAPTHETLLVDAADAPLAAEELARYAAERAAQVEARVRAPAPVPILVFRGAGWGAALYAATLILVAYGAGNPWFGVDWLAAGAVLRAPGAVHEWWRAVTALTLHVDQEHLLGNLLFGVCIGTLAGRLFGAGIAWLTILLSAAGANVLEMMLAPPAYRAVGASTAVFAALGLLTGRSFRDHSLRLERLPYRWIPLTAGVSLLALLGAGDQHVDVLGHLLGFGMGSAVGWAYGRAGLPRSATRYPWSRAGQLSAGLIALLLVVSAWACALRQAVRLTQ